MRVALVTLLAAAASGSVNILSCKQKGVNLEDVISAATCGETSTIVDCLNAELYSARDEQIAHCFAAGGCSVEQSTAAARWLDEICHDSAGEAGELRRAASSEAESTAGSESTAKGGKKTAENTTEKETQKSEAAASTAAPSSAAASTTSDPPASTAEPTTQPTTPPSAAPSTTAQDYTTSSTSAASVETTSAATTGGPLVCSVTSMVSTTMCSVSAGKTISCYSTVTPVASCAPGNICFPSAPGGGAPVCMKKDNHLTISGLAIAITFGASLIGFTAALIIMNAKDRKQARRLQLLATIAQGAVKSHGDLETAQSYPRGGNRSASEANLPLISPGGTRSDQQYYPQQEYFDQQRRGSNVSPGGRGGVPPVPTIQLHPGLGALDQGSYR